MSVIIPGHMIEFHAGNGPDSQAVGIVLEEMFLSYRVMPGRAPIPVISFEGARVVGPANIALALARKTGRFLPDNEAVMSFANPKAFDAVGLEDLLTKADYIAGALSVADMAVYPLLVREPELASGCTSLTRWMRTMSRRPATGRGMGVVVR